jgi:type I restriction enzyme S subunit
MNKNKLPKGWKYKRLGDMFTFVGGGTPSKVQLDYWNGSLNWASVKDVKGDFLNSTKDFITEKGLKNSASNLAEKGDVILITRISPGKSIITNIRTAVNQDLKIAKPKFKTTPKFIYYFFSAIERDCIKKSSGTTVLGITLNNLNELLIPDLSLEEQNSIVSKIEELFSELDKGIEDLKTAQQQLKTYRQSVLKYAFEGKLTNEKVKEGILPKGWEWTNIKEITTLLGDGLHGTPKYDTNGEYYFINGNNLNDGKIEIKENTKKVSKEEFDKYKKQLNDKTIFVSINGSLGYTAFYNDEPVILGKSACYFNVKEGIDKHYIRYIFTSQRFTNYSTTVATGSTIKNVSLKSMREFEIPLPINIEEQQLIVQEIESRLSVADKIEESIAQSLLQAEALRQSILKKAFSGELV